jgi:CheY-like chemotaxis protein
MPNRKEVEILLVEDNPTDAELTQRALKKNNISNHVVWVKDGAEALDFIFRTGAYTDRPQGDPKLILLDLKLPKVDGLEVLARVKSDPRTKAIPVVMLTSSAQESDIVQSYQKGINSYLVKPIDFGEFVYVVSKAGMYWSILNHTPDC